MLTPSPYVHLASTCRHSRGRCSQAFPVFRAVPLPCEEQKSGKTCKRGYVVPSCCVLKLFPHVVHAYCVLMLSSCCALMLYPHVIPSCCALMLCPMLCPYVVFSCCALMLLTCCECKLCHHVVSLHRVKL